MEVPAQHLIGCRRQREASIGALKENIWSRTHENSVYVAKERVQLGALKVL
jgi:hypothetical protein